MLLNLSAVLLFCLIHLCITGQSRLNVFLLLILYFMQTKPFPGNGLGLKGSLKIIQLLTCPEAPAAPFKPRHPVTVELLIFFRDVEESWCWNAAGTLCLHHSLPSSAVGFRFTRIPSPNQVFSFRLSELQHDGETRMSKAWNWNWQQCFDFWSHFISPSPR